MLYSDKLKEYTGELSPPVQEAITEICDYYKLDQIRVLALDDQHIVIPVSVQVSIPPGGAVGDIDIQPQEQVLIRLALAFYPHRSPSVLSDRCDFPRNRLSHLYGGRHDQPAQLCLIRGSLDEWFSTRRMENLLDVVNDWYHKAATGQLNNDGGEFDPLRMDSYQYFHIYRYERMKQVVEEKMSFFSQSSIACLLTIANFEKVDADTRLVFKTEVPLLPISFKKLVTPLQILEKKNSKFGNVLTSVMVWSSEDAIEPNYEPSTPTNYWALKEYFAKYDIDIDTIVRELVENGTVFKDAVPIIHAIKRPCKLIGFDGPYEFVNFVLFKQQNKRGVIDETSAVLMLNHIEPFTTQLAETLTGETRDKRIIYAGAGSLGSKIILHNARSGNAFIGVSDPDELLQHNLARHSLLSDHVGENKAEVIIKELLGLFLFNPEKDLHAYPIPINYVPEKEFQKYDWLVDSTASQLVVNWLSNVKLPPQLNVARCEIADEGNLGLLYIEGKDRNPRTDDLINLAYYHAIDIQVLHQWRRADATKDQQTLDIGLGCSSLTSVMPDDVIALHAAVFSRLLHKEQDRSTINDKGLLFINTMDGKDWPVRNSIYIEVDPFYTSQCKAGSGWEVRFLNGLREKLQAECKNHKPKETGGVLIGVCNYKTKSIHVFDYIKAPPDSIGTPVSFLRGVVGLSKQIDDIKYMTGDVIGYVGEWHSHPMQLETLSQTDQDTVQELLPINRKTPIPTLSLIVTNTDLLPFIFL